MSVILDALKRVQDENRRRDSGPDRTEPETAVREKPSEPSSNALLQRLSRPSADPDSSASGWNVSPVIWVSAALVLLVLLAAAGLTWLQPGFDGPAVNDGRPLLAQNGAQPAAASSGAAAGGAIQERFGGGGSSGNGASGGESGAAGVPGAASSDERQAGDDLFSDLSANLDSADQAAADAAGQQSDPPTAEGEDDSMLRLEVEERPAPQPERQPTSESAAGGDEFLDLRSARPEQSGGAPQREWVPPSSTTPESVPAERGATSTPTRLVDPGVRAAFNNAVRMHKAGDLAGAAEAYERALKADPRNARVNANLGVLYETLGQFEKAERHLREAVQSEPDNAAAHNNLGVVLYRQGKYDAALIEFNRTLQLDPRWLEAYTNKGLIYTRWGQLDEAERAFRQVLAIDSRNALAHYNLGLVYEEAGRYAAAIDAYYEFLDHGGLEHPEITAYLERHLRWLEQRQLETGDGS